MSDFFKPRKQVLKTPEQAYAELLGNSSENQIVEIDVNAIDEIDNQPQKIHEDKIDRIAESMNIVGQLDPIIVIPNQKQENRYILIAGRHRRRACIKLGLNKVKAVIRKETNPDKQRLMLLATNNDRNTDYSPSELAFSYKEQTELLKKLGSKSTASQVAEGNNTNRKTVHKYIQLTKLISPLLSRVDSNSITVGAGYELSFLSTEEQTKVFNFILNHPDKSKIDKDIARAIRLSPDDLQNIFYPITDSPSLLENDEETSKEMPKAEKKIKTNCPSEGQKNKNDCSTTTVKNNDGIFSLSSGRYEYLSSEERKTIAEFVINKTNADFYMLRYAYTPQEIIKLFDEYYKTYSSGYGDVKFDWHYRESGKNLELSYNGKNFIIPFKVLDEITRLYVREYTVGEINKVINKNINQNKMQDC